MKQLRFGNEDIWSMFSSTFFKPILEARSAHHGRAFTSQFITNRFSPDKKHALFYLYIDEPANNYPLYEVFFIRNRGQTVSRAPNVTGKSVSRWSASSRFCEINFSPMPLIWDTRDNSLAAVKSSEQWIADAKLKKKHFWEPAVVLFQHPPDRHISLAGSIESLGLLLSLPKKMFS